MNHLSLFTGYGGFELGLKLAEVEFRTVGYVEIEPYCQRIIQARIADGILDHAPIIRDIRTCDFRPMAGLVDIITAGFPCQPHSITGQRKGEDDERNLWPDTLWAIREVRPKYALLENAGIHLRNRDQPAYAYTVLADLAALGYDCQWGIVAASDADAWHRRERWWCLATDALSQGRRQGGDGGKPIQRTPNEFDGNATDASNPDNPRRQAFGRNGRPAGSAYASPDSADENGVVADSPECGSSERESAVRSEQAYVKPDPSVADADCCGCGCSFGQIPSRESNLERGIADATGIQDRRAGFSRGITRGVPWWSTEPGVVRMVHGGPHRVDRIKALGNGIVPPVVGIFLRAIEEQDAPLPHRV